MRVPPDCTKSSTMTTCLPLGDPSLSRTIRLSPSLTFVQITCSNGQDSGLRGIQNGYEGMGRDVIPPYALKQA